MKSTPRVVALVAVAAAVVAWLKRPVKRPETYGTWSPADSERTRR